MSWFVYVLECADTTLYTGSTTDYKRRLLQHNSGRGAKYTRSRRPVVLKKVWPAKNRSEAQCIEAAIKKLSRFEKKALIDGPVHESHFCLQN